MNAEQFLILLDSVAESNGLAGEGTYKALYWAVYDQLQRCAYCGGECRLEDERKCADCRRNAALRCEGGE